MPVSIDEAKRQYPEAEVFKFGDNRALCEHLLALVWLGKKRATCGALRDFDDGKEPMPVVGRRDIALDWDGVPILVIETVEVTIRRFCDVNADFALSEGEDDTLEDWQSGHQSYFERNGGWHPEMNLVCERFNLIED